MLTINLAFLIWHLQHGSRMCRLFYKLYSCNYVFIFRATPCYRVTLSGHCQHREALYFNSKCKRCLRIGPSRSNVGSNAMHQLHKLDLGIGVNVQDCSTLESISGNYQKYTAFCNGGLERPEGGIMLPAMMMPTTRNHRELEYEKNKTVAVMLFPWCSDIFDIVQSILSDEGYRYFLLSRAARNDDFSMTSNNRAELVDSYDLDDNNRLVSWK